MGLTPFQCILNYQLPLFPCSGKPSEVPAVNHLFQESETIWGSVHVQLQGAFWRHKSQTNVRRAAKPTYHQRQKVWLSTRETRLRLPFCKLSPRFIGPFTIQCQINYVTYRLSLPPQYKISPTFHVSLLKPHHDSFLPSSTGPGFTEVLPSLVEAEDNQIYTVQSILVSQ